MGFSFITGQQTIMHADNASFDGTERAGALSANGQLWIGSAGSPHVVKNTLTAGTGVSITNGPGSITIGLTGGFAAVEHLTGDTGGQLNPDGSNNFNLLGQLAGSTTVFDTIGSGSTISFESRTWTTPFIVDPSSTVGLRGTFTTIQAAVTAASAGQTIFVRAGTYTENITLKAGVNITAYSCDALQSTLGVIGSNVTIVGKLTATYTGTCAISGIALKTNSDFCIVNSGANVTELYLINCTIDVNNNTAISFTNSNSASRIWMYYCLGNIDTVGITYFSSSSTGSLNFFDCVFNGTTSTAATISAGSVGIHSCIWNSAITTSGTSAFDLDRSEMGGVLTVGGSGPHNTESSLISTSTTSLSIGGTCTLVASGLTIFANTGGDAIGGTGVLQTSPIAFTGSSSAIAGTITLTPLQFYPLAGVTQYDVLVGAAKGVVASVGPGSAGQVLQSGGNAANPAYSTATYPATTTINQILYSSSANVVAGLATANSGVLTTGATGIPVITALASNGQLIIGSGSGAPAAATLSAGTGITITNAANSITISASTSGFSWTDVTGATQTIAAENGYITDRGAGVTYTLPASGSLGDTFKIVGKLGLATITPLALQQLLIGSASGTVGITGTAVATNVGDCIEFVCITSGASTVWRASDFVGNWTLN